MEPSSADLGNRNQRPLKREGKEHVELEEFARRVRHRVPARIKEARQNAKAEVRDKKLQNANIKLPPKDTT